MSTNKQLGDGIISLLFKEKDIFTFAEACTFVKELSYNRNSTKEDPLIVLKESCGTCSSKHELIKRLADENEIEGCALILCMFKMSDYNTPKVEAVLEKYGLDYIPEAHTYVMIDEEVMDLTFPENDELLYLEDVLFVEEINADQIRAYKVETHKAYLKKWCVENEVGYSFESIWEIREECIMALAL